MVSYLKQARKGFRTKARDQDFIEFRIQMNGDFFLEFFNNFEQNTCGTFQWHINQMILGILQEFKKQMTTEFLGKYLKKNSGGQFQYPNNSDDYPILQKLDDLRILMKFDQIYLQELDDHIILVKFFKNFNQN